MDARSRQSREASCERRAGKAPQAQQPRWRRRCAAGSQTGQSSLSGGSGSPQQRGTGPRRRWPLGFAIQMGNLAVNEASCKTRGATFGASVKRKAASRPGPQQLHQRKVAVVSQAGGSAPGQTPLTPAVVRWLPKGQQPPRRQPNAAGQSGRARPGQPPGAPSRSRLTQPRIQRGRLGMLRIRNRR